MQPIKTIMLGTKLILRSNFCSYYSNFSDLSPLDLDTFEMFLTKTTIDVVQPKMTDFSTRFLI